MTFYSHPAKCPVCGEPKHKRGVSHEKCARELQRKYAGSYPVKVGKKKR